MEQQNSFFKNDLRFLLLQKINIDLIFEKKTQFDLIQIQQHIWTVRLATASTTTVSWLIRSSVWGRWLSLGTFSMAYFFHSLARQ